MGYGAMQLAGPGVFGPPRDRGGGVRARRRAGERGVDHIDTAQFYGPDVVNDLIREALHPYPEHLKLATKAGARRDARGGVLAPERATKVGARRAARGGVLAAKRPDELREDVEANLRSLRVERLDLVNLRLLTPPPAPPPRAHIPGP